MPPDPTSTNVSLIKLTEYLALSALLFGMSYSTAKDVFRARSGAAARVAETDRARSSDAYTQANPRPSRGSIWTVDYLRARPDPSGRGFWGLRMVAVVRAMSPQEAIEKVRFAEREKIGEGYRIQDVTIEPGHHVPGYPASAILS